MAIELGVGTLPMIAHLPTHLPAAMVTGIRNAQPVALVLVTCGSFIVIVYKKLHVDLSP